MSAPYGEVTHEVKRSPWFLGVIYADPSDPRVIVRHRVGIGWTLNFGQPAAWAFVVALVALTVWRRQRRGQRR